MKLRGNGRYRKINVPDTDELVNWCSPNGSRPFFVSSQTAPVEILFHEYVNFQTTSILENKTLENR